MAIHVIQSQRIDVLVQGLLHNTAQPSKNPFAVLKTQHFIVPSPAVQEWLTQKIAEHQGISANNQFHQRIRGFQWFAYQQILENKDKVRKANIPRLIMKWRIYQTLKNHIDADENQLSADHPLFGIVKRIYDSAAQLEHGFKKQLKKQSMLYWVSEQVSKLFGNYMLYRGDCQKNCVNDGRECTCTGNWLGQWGRNQALNLENQFFNGKDEISAFTLSQAEELESWQRWLWQHTFHDDFIDMQSIDADFWAILDDELQRPQALKKLPSRLTVFTLLDLPPSQLQFLRRLGQYIDVVILHYNPSQEYWADSVDPNWKKQYDLRVKERFIAKNPKATDAEINQFFDQFTLNFNAETRESRHPLLTRFGKQARDHFSILSNLSSGEEGQWIDAFVDEEPTNLLTKLQSDILYLVEPEEHAYSIAPTDHSIQINICHSGLRQLEVLKDQMIHWLAQGTTEQPRRPSDILILTPDLKQIEPLIRSVFPHIPNQDNVYLPVKIAGVTQLDASNAWRAVLGRMTLVDGRFSVEDFADWLSLNATQIRYELDVNNTDRMVDLLISAGFKRGLDAGHLQRSLSQDDQDFRFTFKYALDRLALGIAIPEHTLFDETLSYAQVMPSDFELIAKLIQIYHDFDHRRDWMIAHELGKETTIKSHVEAWLNLLMKDIAEFEQAGVEILKSVREIVKKQERMLTLAYRNTQDETEAKELKQLYLPLPYLLNEIANLLDGQMDQALPTGQITFSQIGQIRPLPYKLIVMLNLDGGKFPNRSVHLPFDLMEILKPQLGDRSRLDDDQGAFLDALLLAKENLWLFYNGFDVSDGEVRDPSSVLQELISHIAFITKSACTDVNAVESDAQKIIQETHAQVEPAQETIQPYKIIKPQGVEMAEQVQSLYQIHTLQPFDIKGFESVNQLRYRDQWFSVAQKIRQVEQLSERKGWANVPYPNVAEQESMTVLDAGQWIQDVTFPARLYLKTLGVENLRAQDLPALNEPLVLDGLAKYQIRDFLQKQDTQDQHNKADQALLQDQLPIGKVQYSAWQMSLAEQASLKERLKIYATDVTQTTQRQWRIQLDLVMNITVPKQVGQDWVSLDASSARGKRRAKVWLEYLLWLTYLAWGDDQSRVLKRIAVFSDVTIINEGLTSAEAKAHLLQWFKAYAYGQSEPLVLPAELLMAKKQKSNDLLVMNSNQEVEWGQSEAGQSELHAIDAVLKEWNKSDAFLPYSLDGTESSKKHRDWQFILQEQDTTALLKHACDTFAYDLYNPIYTHQKVAEEQL